ncbi:putative phage abortive infection protein [Photobacterium leiognathi]|uniref:putative phage abortive infection protein n=1 Tax=Photobacterium leiognathi TaxID=553611 RepID=UPI00273821FB|nr:putative phage abortive infection protein [Photobacterium leiognathi]
MDISRSCNITIEPCQAGYEAKVSFDAFSTVKEEYNRTITRATRDELELAIDDLKKSFPDHHMSVKKVSNFPMKSSSSIHLFLAFLGIIILLCIAFFGYTTFTEQPQNISNNSWDKVAAFFNNVGAPIVALLSYIALLYTLHQQNKSHALSLEELALTRKELSDSTLAQKTQADTLKLQLEEAQETAKRERFDSTFYSLLEQHNSVLDKLSAEDITKGHKSLKQEFEELHSNPLYCRYFRLLYQVLKFIAVEHSSEESLNQSIFRSSVKNEEKFYSNIVRSMLPDHVLYWLAINCYCPLGESDPYIFYKKLIIRYKFLEHLTLAEGDLNQILTWPKYGENCLVLMAYRKEDFGENLHLSSIHADLIKLENILQPNTTPKKRPTDSGEDWEEVPNHNQIYFKIVESEKEKHKLNILSDWKRNLDHLVKDSAYAKNDVYMQQVVSLLSTNDSCELERLKSCSVTY